jgi:hypothetical protein
MVSDLAPNRAEKATPLTRCRSARDRVPISLFLALLLPVIFYGEAGHLLGAIPTLTHLYPVAVQVGTTTTVTAVGKFTPWPPQVWTDTPGICFSAEKTNGQFTIEVRADAAVGPHLVRVFNEAGASAPRFLMVTADQQGKETEPNDEFAKAPMVASLSATINARLDKSGDVDSYKLWLEAGQTLIASVEAYRLASPMDAVLRLVDPHGREIALNHDDGRTFDPLLVWEAPAAGAYILQVFGFALPATSEAKFTGSDACVYRLHLSGGPQIRYTLPLGISRAGTTKLRAFGWNLGVLAEREYAVDGTRFPPGSREATWHPPEVENALTLALGDGPELLESEIRQLPAWSPGLAAPFAVTGCIEKIGEEDPFIFRAVKGEQLLLEIQSASLGFPLDALLTIQNAGGKELVRNDDGDTADPQLAWTAPESGNYMAVVRSVLHRAGADHLYRLSIQPARPQLKATIEQSAFAIAPGKTIAIKVAANRIRGFKSKATASIVGLPEGLTASPVELNETEKEITLQLVAAADARPFNGPFQIHFCPSDAHSIPPAIHEMVSTSLKNGVPQGFRDLVIPSTQDLWLTVLIAPPSEPAETK